MEGKKSSLGILLLNGKHDLTFPRKETVIYDFDDTYQT